MSFTSNYCEMGNLHDVGKHPHLEISCDLPNTCPICPKHLILSVTKDSAWMTDEERTDEVQFTSCCRWGRLYFSKCLENKKTHEMRKGCWQALHGYQSRVLLLLPSGIWLRPDLKTTWAQSNQTFTIKKLTLHSSVQLHLSKLTDFNWLRRMKLCLELHCSLFTSCTTTLHFSVLPSSFPLILQM